MKPLVFLVIVLAGVGPVCADGSGDLHRSDVFVHGDGVGNAYAYRIPAVTVSKKGTVLAFAERRTGLHDHAKNDMVLRRSTDGGATWGDLIVVAEEGDDSLNDPCVVVLESGRVLLRYKRYPQGVHARNSDHTVIAEGGYGGPMNVRVYLTHSDDDGLTWSRPRDVTRQMRREQSISLGSPGVAIVLSHGEHKGRIVFPNYEMYHIGGGKRTSANSVSYSDDGGRSWTTTGTIDEGDHPGTGNEAQLVELGDGRIMMSARVFGGREPRRKVSYSNDGGATWSPFRHLRNVDTPACASSVIWCAPSDKASPGFLLHSVPNTKKSRSNGTLFVSRDGGDSWQKSRVIEPGDFAYSCLTRLPNGDIGCLYETERYRRIVFVRIPRHSVASPDARKELNRRAKASQKSRNVLFIAVDDLRTQLGCYGADHIKSPNIDRLASRGLLFERAYCQQAVCNPSRTSIMTGLRPNTIGITGNHRHFRSNRPDVVTLSQHFKNHGYHAQSIGKIYHGVFPDGASITKWDTMGDPPSWSVPTTRFGPRYYYTEDGIAAAKTVYQKVYKPKNPGPDDWTKKLVFGPLTESPDVSDDTLYDGKVARAAVATLRERAASGEPFFLAVGFIKPHTPFVAPKKYYDLYDPAELALAENPAFPIDTPPIAGHGSGEARRYTDQPNKGPFTEPNQRRIRQGYFACISYIDAQIGLVIDELDRLGLSESTTIVLWGDHGWHLGEHGLWGKTTNFEIDTRVPLIVVAPGMKATGRTSRALVELVDLYPTLVEICGLPRPDDLDGTSFRPLLDAPDRPWKAAAFSQFPRGGNANTGGKVMGYSMRTDRYRFTEWVDRASGDVVARELYDHAHDGGETRNLTADPSSNELLRRLAAQRAAGWRAARPR